MAAVDRLIGMTHDVLGKVRRLRRPARGNVVWFGGRPGSLAISAPDLNQEWSYSLPHLRVPIFVFLLRAFVAGSQPGNLDQPRETHLEAASIILSPNKSYPHPHIKEKIRRVESPVDPLWPKLVLVTKAHASRRLRSHVWTASQRRGID
jgi:hypothetical protein